MSLALDIIAAVRSNSPTAVEQAFNRYMNNALVEKLAVRRQEIAATLISEITEAKYLNDATDFVLEEIESKGVDALSESIDEAAALYNVPARQIESKLTELFTPVQTDPTRSGLMESFSEMVESASDFTMRFDDNTSRNISLSEARAIVELNDSLNEDNQSELEARLLRSRTSFEQILAFARSV